jgi:hypothetical protein
MLAPLLALAMMQQPRNVARIITFGPNAGAFVTRCRNVIKIDEGRPGDAAEANACLGYLAGIVDEQQFGDGDSKPGFHFCIVSGVTTQQMARIVVKYGDDHPEILNQLAVYIVSKALAQAFPCTR